MGNLEISTKYKRNRISIKGREYNVLKATICGCLTLFYLDPIMHYLRSEKLIIASYLSIHPYVIAANKLFISMYGTPCIND